MQLITGAVGQGAANAAHDVALVQAILLKTTRAATATCAAAPYLASYDGVYGPATLAAIQAFQADHVFVNTTTQQCVPNPNATAGQVLPNDATWTQLLARVPAAFAELRVLPGGKRVYLQATAAQLQTRIMELVAMTFAPVFRVKVRACIDQMHAQHGIAVGVCPQGDRRTFAAQYALLLQVPSVTNAGPGESNHNFGMATDIGFKDLAWLQANGTVDNNETWWLHHLNANNMAQANLFWEALRTVGTGCLVGAFRGPVHDRPHLQNWNDATVSTPARLAAHLQASGTMQWSHSGGVYRCNLGMGTSKYPVGTAAQIWNLQATVTVANIIQARAEKPMPPGSPPVTAATVTAMRQALRAQFDLADTNWQNWTAS
ncbi:MAG: hypothetical protein IPN53_06525 [Comamonadaceae bacterium]|nr:hypothetical protein [Comamonadaceae bacterium]